MSIASKEHEEQETASQQHESNSAAGPGQPVRSLVIPFMIVIALTACSGLVHGMLDGRWSSTEDLVARGQKLESVPESCGDWAVIEKSELDEKAAQILKVHGSVMRTYQHQPTGSNVTVAVLYGPRGPIAVHTPEICYSSVAKEQYRKRKTERLDHSGAEDSLWSVQFMERQSAEPTLDVWYGWSDGGNWIASENPRFWMTDSLYKIQIAGPVGDENFRPCENFLAVFLPTIKELIEK